MYPISNEAKALFESNAAKVMRITGSTVRILPTDIAVYSGDTLVYQSGDSKHLKLYSGSSEIYDNQGTKTVILYSGDKPIFINDEAGMPIELNITSSDVRQGDFSIDRYSCNGQMLEIGTAIASEFTLQIDNVEGQFDGVIFEGVELFVEIGISDPADSDAEIIWVPCGYFTCDHQPRRLNTLSITALDRMMRFDKKPASGSLTLPKTVAQLVAAGCAACNVALGQSLSGLPNANYSVTALPDSQDGISWRDIIRWCAGLMGTNAWIDWNGELRFSWYNNDTGYVSTTDNRFSSDLYENPIIITGVKFTDTDEANTTYIAGTDDYAIDVSDNGFINADNADALLPNIYLAMNGFAYTPFSASAIAAPYLWPMDRVTFTDKNGKGHVSVLTNVNLSVNGSTDIAAVGESAEFYSYGKSSSFTAQQQATLRRLQRVVGTEITDAVESATAQITGAQGGYVRFMYDANGVMTEILIMNTPDIATATKVWRWNQGGFGYSSNGYQGPYTTAITQDGAIVATFITAGILNAAIVKAGILGDVAGKNYWNMQTGEFSLSGEAGLGNSTVGDVLDAVDAAISNVDVEYAQNQSTTTAPTSGWSTTAPAWQEGYYIWQRTKTTSASGTSYSQPTCISGRDGVDGQTGPQGQTGIGVSAVVEQYYLSTSSTEPTGGSWSTDQPQWVSGKYIWTRSQVTWTDNTTTYTTPVLAQAINGANSAASSAQSAVTALDNSLNQQGVFNRLTNNGQTQGIYLSNGLLYINASYIQAGDLSASRIKGGTLTLGGSNNTNGTLIVKDANNNTIGTWNEGGIYVGKGQIVGGSISGTDLTLGGTTGGKLNVSSITTGFESECEFSGDKYVIHTKEIYSSATVDQYIYFGYAPFSSQGGRVIAAIVVSNNNLIRYSNHITITPTGILFTNSNEEDFCGITNTSFYYENGASFRSWLSVRGDLTVYGTKNRVVSTDQYSNRLLYCYETTTPMFGDIGDGVISDDGFCYVMLDAVFAQTVTTNQYQVFLQKYGPGDCWVRERKGAYFIVEGTPGMSFGWEIKAKQRDYDQLRLERNDEKFTVPTQTYGEDAAKHIDEIRKEREVA